jgi:hypothetical protein
VFGSEKYIDDEQGCANGDGGIRDVEGGIVVRAEPNFKKIGDRSVEDPIGNIAGSAAEEQRETRGAETGAALAGREKPREQHDHNDGAGDQNDSCPGRHGIREKTEGDAWIAGANEIEKMMDKFVSPAFRRLSFEPGFRRAVEKHNCERKPEPANSCGKIHEVGEINKEREVKKAKKRK